MKLLRQFGMILLITFAGELLRMLLPLPIPASIYGMLLMLAVLMTGVIRLDEVEQAGDFLIEIMPILFVPAAVGLMDAWNELRPILLAVSVITVVVTVMVMAVTGIVTQWVIRQEKAAAARASLPHIRHSKREAIHE
ncbi:CidA/LrgA family protein [Butyricicoccus porcorum]|uniref:Murein hydrolase regulator LrgA n=1 Tax=Butyricicoccus porcorum TaxID=1945634 RepID=A0A252F3N0_9FIRM|nr:CidA/LrgA family protein [Butyricicoccus porcorum]OUM20398.1 murein hydrolase regulator LrgA [Butyricicoccus porcorum]